MQPDLAQVMRVVDARLAAPSATARLIGVDGPSGSGKSTLARAIAGRLDAPVVKVDDFVTWQHFGAWWPRFEEQVVAPLLAGRDARYQARDWAGDEFGDGLAEWRTVPWAPVVVVEGVTSTRAAVADRLACRLWVEAPPDLRLLRGLRRDGESHRALWDRWMREEAAFFAADGTRARADLIVDTTI
ncbi:uridine kinase family protein [Amnibacterium endophyticum]|uniref:Uridine kinase n=1 Tax=Amnibacterium endophyticum TaxID=2109337 RepID=A0ABW4LAD9_9MICO